MSFLPGQATTHRQQVQRLWDDYDLLIKNGSYYPFGYPFGVLPVAIVIAFLVLPKGWSTPRVRHIAAGAAITNCVFVIFFTRARNPATSALLGITHMWYILIIVAHLLAVDPKEEYARIERRVALASDVQAEANSNGALAKEEGRERGTAADIDKEDITNVSRSTSSKSGVAVFYEWERLPASLGQRFGWALDLSTTLDGMGWTWGIRTIPPPPKHVQQELQRCTKDPALSKVMDTWRRQGQPLEQLTQAQALHKFVRTFLLGWTGLDILKTLGSVDPYFWGYADFAAPPYLPSWLQYPVIVKMARLYIALLSMQLAIQTLLTLRPLYFLYFHTPESAGVRGEAWMFPESFGSFQSILDHGLSGFWSVYWHQSFRYVFMQPSKMLIQHLKWDPRSILGKTLKVYIAFFCSGLLHACLSHTAIGKTSPLRGPLVFFLLQPIGIFLQLTYLSLFRATGLSRRCPRWLGRAGNLAWCHVWGYLTAPLLIEDLAKGGQFLFEPVPFSVLRGLGLGNSDDGFFCWHGRWLTWRSGSRWARIVS